MESAIIMGGSMAGGKLAQWAAGVGNQGSGGSSNNGDPSMGTMGMLSQMNSMLDGALQQSISSTQQYAQKAINEISTAKQSQLQALSGGLTNANTSATNTTQNGLNQYNALNAPYASAGYSALDAATASLGLSSPAQKAGVSSQYLANALNNSTLADQLKQQYAGFTDPFTAPTQPTAPNGDLNYWQDQLGANYGNLFFYNNFKKDPGAGLWNMTGGGTGYYSPSNLYDPATQAGQDFLKNGGGTPGSVYYGGGWAPQGDPGTIINQYQAKQNYNQALSAYQTSFPQYQAQLGQYQTNQGKYQQYSNALNNLQYSPQEQQLVQNYKSGSLF